MNTGASWVQFNMAGSWPRRARRLMYGPNEVPVPQPNFSLLLLTELVQPWFLFQVHLCSFTLQLPVVRSNLGPLLKAGLVL